MTYYGAVRTFLGAKRLECVELAPAFGAPTLNDSASKLDALQTLRVTAMRSFPYVSVFRAAHTEVWRAEGVGGVRSACPSSATGALSGPSTTNSQPHQLPDAPCHQSLDKSGER